MKTTSSLWSPRSGVSFSEIGAIRPTQGFGLFAIRVNEVKTLCLLSRARTSSATATCAHHLSELRATQIGHPRRDRAEWIGSRAN